MEGCDECGKDIADNMHLEHIRIEVWGIDGSYYRTFCSVKCMKEYTREWEEQETFAPIFTALRKENALYRTLCLGVMRDGKVNKTAPLTHAGEKKKVSGLWLAHTSYPKAHYYRNGELISLCQKCDREGGGARPESGQISHDEGEYCLRCKASLRRLERKRPRGLKLNISYQQQESPNKNQPEKNEKGEWLEHDCYGAAHFYQEGRATSICGLAQVAGNAPWLHPADINKEPIPHTADSSKHKCGSCLRLMKKRGIPT